MINLAGLVLLASVALTSVAAYAQQSVSGYYRADGTYVQPYVRSTPNATVQDNYTYRGNTNPYTGATGTNSYTHDTTSPYYTGPNAQGQVGHAKSGLYGGGQ